MNKKISKEKLRGMFGEPPELCPGCNDEFYGGFYVLAEHDEARSRVLMCAECGPAEQEKLDNKGTETMLKIRPFGEKVMVQIEETQFYEGGLFIRPSTTEGYESTALVIAIAEQAEKARRLGLEEGQRVQLRHYGVGRDREVPPDLGDGYCMVPTEDIIGIYEVK